MNNRKTMIQHAKLFCKYPHKPLHMSNEFWEQWLMMQEDLKLAYENLVINIVSTSKNLFCTSNNGFPSFTTNAEEYLKHKEDKKCIL